MVRKNAKLHLHQNTGKLKSLPKTVTQTVSVSEVPGPSTSNNGNETVLDGNPNSEIAQKFEMELCWCIQQLQTALKNGKLNPKQVEEHRKILNTLMSTTAPVVKKRQIMRLTFGDYRAKMMAEDKKFQSQSRANRIKVEPATPNKNSMFIKKSIFSASGKDFKFNFTVPKAGEQDLPDVSSIRIKDEPMEKTQENLPEDPKPAVNSFSLMPSDNSFKFNFSLLKPES